LKALKEITVWDKCEYNVPNHTYLINKSGKMVAYRKEHTKEWFTPAKPIMFERTRRKFVTLPNSHIEDYYA
jgi:hypothetical protein